MRARSYRSIAADEHVPDEAAERYRTLEAYDRLRAAGCGEEAALEQLGISRRTLHRWRSALAVCGNAPGSRGTSRRSWTCAASTRSWARRASRPCWRARERHLSVSTVGRIIERALKAGAIRPASFCEGRVKAKRRRRFAKWARRWKYGAKAAVWSCRAATCSGSKRFQGVSRTPPAA